MLSVQGKELLRFKGAEMPELKPCPWQKKKKHILSIECWDSFGKRGKQWDASIICRTCWMEGPKVVASFRTKTQAITRAIQEWNSRKEK